METQRGTWVGRGKRREEGGVGVCGGSWGDEGGVWGGAKRQGKVGVKIETGKEGGMGGVDDGQDAWAQARSSGLRLPYEGCCFRASFFISFTSILASGPVCAFSVKVSGYIYTAATEDVGIASPQEKLSSPFLQRGTRLRAREGPNDRQIQWGA